MKFFDWTWTRVLLVIAAYWVVVLVAGVAIMRSRARRQVPTYIGPISDTGYLVKYEGSLHLGRTALVVLGPPMALVVLRLLFGVRPS